MEDSKVMSQSCWNREQSIYQLNLLIWEIQKALYSKIQIDTKIEEFIQLITDVKNEEFTRHYLETKTINRYNFLKVDSLHQKKLMFTLLEQILNNYKKLTSLYQNKLMTSEQVMLKQDLDNFKMQLRQKIHMRGGNVAEVLLIVSQCSRKRLDHILETADNNANIWKECFMQQAVKRLRIKIKSRLPTEEDVNSSSPKSKQVILCLAGYKINRMKLSPKLLPMSYFKGDQLVSLTESNTERNFKQTSKNFISAVRNSVSLERGSNSLFKLQKTPQNSLSLLQQDQKSHKNKLSIGSNSPTMNLQDNFNIVNKFPVNLKKREYFFKKAHTSQPLIQDHSKYTVIDTPKYQLPVYLGQYKSEKDTFVPDNYYQDVWNDFHLLNENDQQVFIKREYTDLLKGNQKLNQGIFQYRKSCLLFQKKQIEKGIVLHLKNIPSQPLLDNCDE